MNQTYLDTARLLTRVAPLVFDWGRTNAVANTSGPMCDRCQASRMESFEEDGCRRFFGAGAGRTKVFSGGISVLQKAISLL